MQMLSKFLAGSALTLALAGAAHATPIAITGGVTELEVIANLGAFGLTVGASGTTIANTSGVNPVFTFPVSGGFRDDMTPTPETIIEHAGAGLDITDGAIILSFSDFLIDAAAGEIRADVTDGTDTLLDAGFLTFASVEAGGRFGFDFNPQFGFILDETFGTNGNLGNVGTDFGFARLNFVDATATAQIPLPASLPLLLGGLMGIGLIRRRARPAA